MQKTKNLILIIVAVASLMALEAWLTKPNAPSTNEPLTAANETAQNTPASDQPPSEPDPEGYQSRASDHGTLVRFASQAAIDEFLAKNGFTSAVLTPTASDAYIVDRLIEELKIPGGVEAFPNREYQAVVTPNDPQYSSQWHLPKIAAPAAWDITTGSSSVTIAVVDTGFALLHEDLAGKLTLAATWRDFVCNDNVPQAGDADCDADPTNPNASHGTLTSGAAAAATNNAIGVAGVDWTAKILPLQALGDDGAGFTSDVADAVDYAVSQGVEVISMSLGSTGVDNFLRQSIDDAVAAGVLVVAAAGNCGGTDFADQGCSFQGQMLDPANYGPVLAVGATDQNDNRASFSSYGSTLDVVAPGVSILTTSWSNTNQTTDYGSASGTSLATPVVSGLAALIKSVNPSASVSNIEYSLENGADKVSGMGGQNFTNEYGFGRINAQKSLQSYSYSASSQNAYTTSAKTTAANLSQLSAGQTAWLTVQVTNTGTATWQKSGANPVRLGTEDPKDRISRYYTSGWLSPNRAAALVETSVAPGATGTFEFPIAVPAGGGSFTERFNLVAEGLTWLPDAGISFSTTVNSGYSWSFDGQQAYTNDTKTTVVNTGDVSPGQVIYFVVQAQNTGNATWYRDGGYPTRLATARPADRTSQFFDPSWLSPNRPSALVEPSVAPGAVGTFQAYYRVPNGSGNTNEYLNPVIEGITHLNDVGLHIPANIKSGYSWAFINQQAYTDSTKTTPLNLNTLSPGQTFYFVVRAQNTGTATWFNTGNFPLRLGTSHPLDRVGSLFQHSSWLSSNRTTGLTEPTVAPGETGTFEGTYQAPSSGGNYQEYLQPVAESILWLNDLGLYIPGTVTP